MQELSVKNVKNTLKNVLVVMYMSKITRWFGKILLGRRYCKCRVCNNWTEWSFIEGDICSIECVMKERKLKCPTS